MLLLPIGLLTAAPAAVPAAAPLLLDLVAATAAGAYGFRKLRAAYAGPAVRVRRASDNAEQDVGFAAGDGTARGAPLDGAAMLAFCGAAAGFVSVWYDQSGLGQHAAQATASRQPQIVSGGAVLALGNAAARPGIVLASSGTQALSNTAFAIAGSSFAACLVAARAATMAQSYPRLLSYAAPGQSDYGSPSSAIFGYETGDRLNTYQNGGVGSVPLAGTAPFQLASVFDGARATLTLDGGTPGPGAASGSLATGGMLGIGIGDVVQSWDGTIAEVLVISGALTAADQATIRTSQQGFYGTPA